MQRLHVQPAGIGELTEDALHTLTQTDGQAFFFHDIFYGTPICPG